jgi:hypothetical protein
MSQINHALTEVSAADLDRIEGGISPAGLALAVGLGVGLPLALALDGVIGAAGFAGGALAGYAYVS